MEREPLLNTQPKGKTSRWLIIMAGVLIVGLVGGFAHFKSQEVTVADDGLHGYTEPTETLAVEIGDRAEANIAQATGEPAADASAEPAAATGEPAAAVSSEPAAATSAEPGDSTGAPPAAADETTAAPAAAADETTAAASAADETTAAPAADATPPAGSDADETTAAPAADATPAASQTTAAADVTPAAEGTTAESAEETSAAPAAEQEATPSLSPDGSMQVEATETTESAEETTKPAQKYESCSEAENAIIHNCMTMNNASKKTECDASPNCSFKDEACDFGYTPLQCVPHVATQCLYDIEIDDGDDLYAVMQPGGVCPKIDSSASQITFVLAATLFISWWM